MSDIHHVGFLYDDSGDPIVGATVQAYEKNTTTTAGSSVVTDSNGKWSITTTSDNQLDILITSGSSKRRRKFDDAIQVSEIEVSTFNIREGATAQVYTIAPGSISADRTLTLPAATGNDTLASLGLAQTFSANQTFTGTVTVGSDGSGTDVIFYSGTAGDNMTWDASEELLTITGTNGQTALNVADGNVTIADNLTVSGNLTVTGTTTSVDSTTINTTNAFVFEGANADAYETTLAIVEPTGADKTVYIPNQTGYLPVLASASTTQVSSTPEELNLLDGSSANTVVNSKAVIYGSGGEVAGTLSTAAQTAITSLGTLTALTVDDVAVNGKVITMTGSTGDTAVFTVGTGGTLSLVTTDAAGTDADLTIDADGQINIDANDAAGIFLGINGTNQINLVDGVLKPVTDNDVDLGVSGGPEFKNGYFNGTLEADAVTIGGTNVVTGSLITTLGTVSAGTWEGTTIAVDQGGTGATSLTDKAVLISQDSGTDTVGSVALTSPGQIIIGGSSGPQAATLTAGSNITISNGDGSISIASAAGGKSMGFILAMT